MIYPITMTAIVVMTLAALAAFFWIWWTLPKDQVPPHLSERQLKRLEVQDRLRQTSYQIMTALALASTFLIGAFQLTTSINHWSAENEMKIRQERIGLYNEAIKSLDKAPDSFVAAAGADSIVSLVAIDPTRFGDTANRLLMAYVKNHSRGNEIEKHSRECTTLPPEKTSGFQPNRGEAGAGLQAVASALGSDPVAKGRNHFGYRWLTKPECVAPQKGGVLLNLNHALLNNLVMDGANLSCSDLTQVQALRTSFYGVDFRWADMRGLRAGDWLIEDSHARNGHQKPYALSTDTIPDWSVSRCWTTSFRGAKLKGANLSGSTLTGADFRGAEFDEHTNWCRADVSRADFRGAKGLNVDRLQREACVGKDADSAARAIPEIDAQPLIGSEDGKTFERAKVRKCWQGQSECTQ